MGPRYKKIIGDITSDYAKNLLLVLAITIGVFGIGTIGGGYSVLKREMARNYLGSNPAFATIELANGMIKPELLDAVGRLPGVKTAVRHATVLARMKIQGEWRPILLFVIDDFKHQGTNKFNYISGAEIPPAGAMLVERTALSVMHSGIGEKVLVQTAHGSAAQVTIAGTVHDPGLAPARQEQTGYGYITLQTLRHLGETQGFNEIRLVFDNPDMTSVEATDNAKRIASSIERNGFTIKEIQVPPPHRHPHQGQMEAILSMFSVFSYLILLLSSVLVAVSVSTLMVRQVREIGIMKTIGAGSRQIFLQYIIVTFCLCVPAVAIGVPLSRFAAAQFYRQIATLLNLSIIDRNIPGWVLLIQVLSGFVIPMGAALFPVQRGSRITVREALGNHGISGSDFGAGGIERKISRLQMFGETFTLAIRNVFRKRSRLAMTLALLATGGTMFMSALNVSKAWDANLAKIYRDRRYDLEVSLNEAVAPDNILEKMKQIPGIRTAEAWGIASTAPAREVPYEISHTYPDKGHGRFIMLGVPPDTPLLNLPLQEGRWLTGESSSEVVLNQLARDRFPGIGIGDSVSLAVNNRPYTFRVAGFVEEVGSPASAFVSYEIYEEIAGRNGLANMFRISFEDRNAAYTDAKTSEIEVLLSRENVSIQRSIPVSLLHNAMAEHMGVLVNSLLTMAVLMGLVGALGLASAMSMNVMERTREIGVLRAIGGTPKKIRSLVTGEGLLVGLASLLAAFGPALLLSYAIGRLVGNMAFRTPLPLGISIQALLIWLVIIVGGSIAATILPANRAVRIAIRDALSYE